MKLNNAKKALVVVLNFHLIYSVFHVNVTN